VEKKIGEGATLCPFCGTRIEEKKAVVVAEKPAQKRFFCFPF